MKNVFPIVQLLIGKQKEHAADFSHEQKTPELLPFQLTAYDIFFKHLIIIIVIIIIIVFITMMMMMMMY